mgnify:FL=1
MELDERRAKIIEQLAAAQAAHAEYEATTLNGVYDQQWADWYAEYLLAHGWNDLFSQSWAADSLTAALRQADAAHRATAPQQRWHEFYAAQFVPS